MRLLNSFSFVFFLIFLISEPCKTISQNSSVITDLESIDSSGFTTEANNWIYFNALCPTCIFTMPANTCDSVEGTFIYGGPESDDSDDYVRFYQRAYTTSSTWSFVGFEFDFWVFTTAKMSDSDAKSSALRIRFRVNNDAEDVANFVLISICETNYVRNGGIHIKYMYRYRIQHGRQVPSPTNTIIFSFRIPSAASSVDSIGARNFTIYNLDSSWNRAGIANFPCASPYFWDGNMCQSCYSGCASCSGPSMSECTACISTSYLYGNGSCLATCAGTFQEVTGTNNCTRRCLTGFYWARNNSCVETCEEPLVQSFDQNGLPVCSSPCVSSANFVYPDKSCSATCVSPLKEKSETTIKLCLNPCLTAGESVSSLYLYPDSSCDSTCLPYLNEETVYNVKYCKSSCSSGKVIYPDGSCKSGCDSPLRIETKHSIQFCVSPCDLTMYLYSDGTCDSICLTHLSDETTENVKYCKSSCSSTEHIYPDGSCKSACDSPLTSNTKHSISFCTSACNDQTMYLYSDGSCDSTCLTHLDDETINDVKYCKSTCLSTEHIYPDGNCKSACDSPLTSEIKHSISFCTSPCNPSDLTMYLYPDSSCDKCPTSLGNKVEYNIQYCYHPCTQDKPFLNQNGICQETCTSPSITKIKSIGKFCQLPCANPDHYFNTQSGKCTETCEYPGEAVESPLPKLCKSSLSEEEVKQVKAMAETTNNANSASSTGTMIWSVISSSDSTSACMGPLSKMLQYIKFMDIRFPEKVLLMMDEQNKDALKGGFAKKMMGDALDKFPRHELPSKFELYQTPSSFFVNLWPALFNLSVILLVTVLMIILTESTKGNAKVNRIFKSVSEILKWNVFLVTFCGSIGDIVLYTALEFQTMQFDNAEAVFSFISCLGINTLAILVVVKILDINSVIRRSKKGAQDEEQKKSIEQKWSSYKALFECYKDYSFFQQIFLFVFVMRLALFNAIIGYLYSYPLFQAIVSVAFSTLMLGYLIFKRPMKKLVNLIQQIILELVLLPFNVSVMALAIMDEYEIAELDHRKSLGNVIVYINVMVPILSLVLMAVKFIVMAFDLYKSWKLAKINKGKKLEAAVHTFHSNDMTQEKLRTGGSFFTQSSPNKSLADNTQILDLTDQSMMPMEHHPIQSSPVRDPRIRPLRPNFMGKNYDHKNSISMTTSQNLIRPEYQNGFQQQESQFPMRRMQEERQDQYFQNEISPQNLRRRIRQRRDHTHIQNHPLKKKFGLIE